ncbi:hypothetical protein LTS06_002205 [Exophiala xenobiotica]|nr:hypothetical protein LTS06_002205 [Exophiala xenobiotica]
MPRKRTRDEMEASTPEGKKPEPSLLQRVRNMWEFASTMQFIFIFGRAVKIDEDFDIEDFENECLKPGSSEKLEEIGLTLLKWISSHRGLDYNIWDEYTRRQYIAKAPNLNPYGEEETPRRFRDFDIFTKIRVLHQLTIWTFWNPDRIRERMPEHPREVDQLEWRIEEFGYDREDRNYYLLDDNRLYRRSEPPPPPAPKAKAKANSKKALAAKRRESKRRRLTVEAAETSEDNQEENDETQAIEEKNVESWEVDTFGGFKWECIAISLTDYHELCESLKKSKDPNEKALRDRLISEVIPIIEAAEEKQRRKIERRQRELMLMEKMVGAKRSNRLADKQDREKREAEEAEAERKRQAGLLAAHQEQERQEKMEQERQYRMMTREQRIKDREYKRLLKEEELARDAIEQKKIEEGEVRGSDRNLKQRMEKNKKELEDLVNEEDWTFDCSGCGIHGKNLSSPMGQTTVNGASANGYTDQAQNGLPPQLQATPRQRPQSQISQTPTTQPLSGLSPRKQQTPQQLPPPSMIPQKPNSISPPLLALHPSAMPGSGPAEKRTVSGTPVLPPVENLRPSPQQLRNMSSTEPVPTPSKQPQPSPQQVGGIGIGTENGVSGEASSSPSTNVGESKPQVCQHVAAEVQTA